MVTTILRFLISDKVDSNINFFFFNQILYLYVWVCVLSTLCVHLLGYGYGNEN